MMLEKFYHNRSVVVTGGAGFIGSHLVDALVSYGAKVTVIDNLSTGNLQNLSHHKNNIEFVEGDITNTSTYAHAVVQASVIFHLAAFVSVPASVSNPQDCYETNVLGTVNLLEMARKYSIPYLVFSSSSAVYGDYSGICSESTPCTPTSVYGYSKLMGELLCKQYAQTFDIHTTILRYFNVYGERQSTTGAYAAVRAKFVDAFEKNLPITIFGDGTQRRDFIPVHKVVEANLHIAASAQWRSLGEIYNIASGKSISILELIQSLKEQYPHFTAPIEFAGSRPGDIYHSQADCTAYQKAMTSYPD